MATAKLFRHLKIHRLSLPLLLLLLLLPSLSSSDLAPNDTFPGLDPSFTCDASIGQCDLASEHLMDSEINRRILAGTSGYISYGALAANRVPCSSRGRSYYNCKGSGPANPYTRGCSRITRCQRDIS